MRKFVRPLLLGLAGFFLGGLCLYGYLKASPESARGLLGGGRPAPKPIVSALSLPQNHEEEEAAQAPVPPPAKAPGARAGVPPIFDQDDAAFFGGGGDPFAVVRKMQRQMEEEMRAGLAAGGGEAFEAGGEEIKAREDAQSFSYEIKGVEGATLSTSVDHGYLTITGETKKQSGGMSFQSSFQRSLSLPPNVDATRMETISEKDKVVLRFPKKS